jgi:hypothetical protein
MNSGLWQSIWFLSQRAIRTGNTSVEQKPDAHKKLNGWPSGYGVRFEDKLSIEDIVP